MNILGVGPAELLLIFVIALIVLGPDKLPEVARTLGKTMGEFWRKVAEARTEFDKALRDMEAIPKEVRETMQPAFSAGDSKKEPMKSDVQETTTQAEAEKKALAGTKKLVGDDETEDHE